MKSQCYCNSLRTAARKVTALYDQALASVGVNLSQFSMLRRLERAGEVSITELSRLCELDRSTTGRNVKVLERMGLVTAVAGEDQREATLSLSKRGRHVLDEGAPHWKRAQDEIERKLGSRRARELLSLGDDL
ncbi:MarR family winged helix-turn-helix transcriptional regulator [Taklimakanibacter deserti]|uniref:MarR family winged helix-turn-helix transcriptional regulator n=1 Tax=Taklimakanibacter deserti TaxID=2267839 RepID=UPI000E653DAB